MIDIDKNQQISYTEFLVATIDPREVDIAELNRAFRMLDEDGNGVITKDEMRKVIKVLLQQLYANNSFNSSSSKIVPEEGSLSPFESISRRVSSEECPDEALEKEVEERLNAAFAQADLNHDGSISYPEFIWAMTGMFPMNTCTNEEHPPIVESLEKGDSSFTRTRRIFNFFGAMNFDSTGDFLYLIKDVGIVQLLISIIVVVVLSLLVGGVLWARLNPSLKS